VWKFPTALAWFPMVGPALFAVAAVVLPQDRPVLTWLGVLGVWLVFDFNNRLLRRSCVLDDRQLRAKGRYARRTVELADLRQVSLGIAERPIWVQTHHPLDKRGATYLVLRMIPCGKGSLSGYPTGQQAVDLIRARAEAAGAKLDPPIPPTRARSRKALIFSS
jgi:hypothetical protein